MMAIESYHKEFKQMLARLNKEDSSDAVISWQFTGFVAGLAFALQHKELAAEANVHLRREWLSISGPGGPYQPSIMADKMASALKQLGAGGISSNGSSGGG
jgi:hypothetical protein